MAIKHTVPASLPTGTSAGKVAGDDWRADHVHVPFCYLLVATTAAGSDTTGTLAGAVTQEIANAPHMRILVDLSNASQMRIVIGQRVIGASPVTVAFRMQYATNGATQTTWSDANNTGSGLDLLTGTANTLRSTGWVDLVSGAKIDDCYMRAVVVVGAGTMTTAATFNRATVEFR